MTSPASTGKLSFSTNTIIADAIAHGPNIAAVFIRYRMYCVGCTFARFESLRAAALNHRVDVEDFVEALNQAVRDAAELREESQPGDSATSQPTEEA